MEGHTLWCPCSGHDLIGRISPKIEPIGSDTGLGTPELLGPNGTAEAKMAVGDGGLRRMNHRRSHTPLQVNP